VTPEQTAQTYNRIAQHWDTPAFNRMNGIAQHERALAFAASPGIALDLGCGSSGRIMTLLRARGWEVEGLDYSEEMLARARRHHPDVVFHHADICTWQFPRTFDFISAWDSIWHVPLPDQLPVLSKICAALAPAGVCIFTTGGVETPNEVTNPCFGEPLYHAAPGIPAILEVLATSGCACRHLEYDGPKGDTHVYLIAQRLAYRIPFYRE
jgi:trans-aconitate methyltransferase